MGLSMLEQQLSFSTREACGAAGLTYRVVDYWVRAGAVTPSVPARGTGTQRGWSVADVERLTRVGRVVHDAERAGLTVNVAAVAAMWADVDGWSVILSA